MELNLGKTEIIVFRKGGYLRNYEKWFYDNKQIRTTSWTSAKIKLASQAQKAIQSIKNYEIKNGYLLHTESFKLFDSMVKPILCYASQIWGYEYCELIESVHINFCKKKKKKNWIKQFCK